MPSSVIADIKYNNSRQQLFIRFLSGALYVYDNVPGKIAEAFRAAISKGTYFNNHIKGSYHFKEIESRYQ